MKQLFPQDWTLKPQHIPNLAADRLLSTGTAALVKQEVDRYSEVRCVEETLHILRECILTSCPLLLCCAMFGPFCHWKESSEDIEIRK